MIFAINNSPTDTLTGMYMYFDDGYPKAHEVITEDSDDLVMTPEVVSISPSEGSIAGTKVEVTAPGVTVSSVVDLVDAEGNSICESVSVEEFGKITCITIPEEIDSEISILKDGETYSWYSRAVSNEEEFCPDVPEIYTPEYWQVFYEENHGIDEDTFYDYMLDDLSFDFGAQHLDMFDYLTEQDIIYYLDTLTGVFDWSAYHRGHNDFLTMADISVYMDDDSGEFDWETYESDQLALMTPDTLNEGMNVEVSWTQPAYLEIEAYRIEFLAADGSWYDTEGCDGSTYEVRDELACTLDQDTLKAFPFDLTLGDIILAKVTAYDSDGEEIAESDTYTDGAVIQDVPFQMSAPARGSETDETKIQIEISEPDLDQAGGSEVTQYIVQWSVAEVYVEEEEEDTVEEEEEDIVEEEEAEETEDAVNDQTDEVVEDAVEDAEEEEADDSEVVEDAED